MARQNSSGGSSSGGQGRTNSSQGEEMRHEKLSEAAEQRERNEQGRFVPENEKGGTKKGPSHSRSQAAEERPRDSQGRFESEGGHGGTSKGGYSGSSHSGSPSRSQAAEERPRDDQGRFMPEDEKSGPSKSGYGSGSTHGTSQGHASTPQGEQQRREKLSEAAEDRPRDQFGRFLPEDESKRKSGPRR